MKEKYQKELKEREEHQKRLMSLSEEKRSAVLGYMLDLSCMATDVAIDGSKLTFSDLMNWSLCERDLNEMLDVMGIHDCLVEDYEEGIVVSFEEEKDCIFVYNVLTRKIF